MGGAKRTQWQSIEPTITHEKRMTTLRVHFRGVGVYVANAPAGRLTEVLFPKADEGPPDGQELGFETRPPDAHHPGQWKKRIMKHADGSDANEHFAGAVIVAKDGSLDHRDLTRRMVTRLKPDGTDWNNGVDLDPSFVNDIPELDGIVTKLGKPPLTLLHDRKNSKRIATKIVVGGDSTERVVATANFGAAWGFDGLAETADYRLEGLWAIEADSVVFKVADLSSSQVDKDIVLDKEHKDVYFYNYDIMNPTPDQLREVLSAAPDMVDNDFKWVYKLFEKPNSKWQGWCGTAGFPAPRLAGPTFVVDQPMPLVSVSTCFEAVWTGGNA
jgi:hypothetical protein